MFKINERSKNDLVFKGIINLIGGKQSNSYLFKKIIYSNCFFQRKSLCFIVWKI